MRITITLTILLISSFAALAQKCKYDFEKKDPFTGKYQKGVSVSVAGFGDTSFRILLQAEEKKYILGLAIFLPGDNVNAIQQGDSLLLAFDNGKILTLLSNAKYLPNAQIMYNNIFTYYMPFYNITENDLKMLETTKLTAVKLQLGSQPLQVEALKNIDNLQKAVVCIKL